MRGDELVILLLTHFCLAPFMRTHLSTSDGELAWPCVEEHERQRVVFV